LANVSRPSNLPLSPLPQRPVVYVNVRFRREDDENTEENTEWTDRSDPKVNPHIEVNSREFTFQSDQSVQQPSLVSDSGSSACCKTAGQPLLPWCRLCPLSPTYWQRDRQDDVSGDETGQPNGEV